MSSPSDEELVKRFQNSSGARRESVLSELYERYLMDLRWYLMRLTQNRKLAIDLTQETFVKVIRGLDDFRRDSSFKTWIFRIATNTWKDYLKKNRPVASGVKEEDKTTSHVPEEHVQKRERMKKVSKAVDALPEKLRVAIVLVRFEDMKYREAASTLGISLSALKMRVKRGLKKLKEMLTE